MAKEQHQDFSFFLLLSGTKRQNSAHHGQIIVSLEQLHRVMCLSSPKLCL